MRVISSDEMNEVSGGFWNFFAGYIGGKAIDGLIEAHKAHVEEFSVRDHSNSNRYFEENREDFNPLL